MSRIRRASALIPMPKAYVSSVLKKINSPCGALWTGQLRWATTKLSLIPFSYRASLDFDTVLVALAP